MEIRVIDVIKKNNRIEINYTSDCDFMNKDEIPFFIYDFNIEDIPNSIAILPFIGSILTACFLRDVTLYVDEIDKDFYNQIDSIRDGFKKLFNYELELKGKVIPNRIIDNSYTPKEDENALLFSGGVDAFYTLLKNKEDIHRLVYLRFYNNAFPVPEGIDDVIVNSTRVAVLMNKKYDSVGSNVKAIVHLSKLDDIFSLFKGRFSLLMHHGPAFISLLSVIGYRYKSKSIYISSSTSPRYTAPVATNPITDPLFKFASCRVTHYGNDVERIEKAKYLSDYEITHNNLHVCFTDKLNCSKCEKCLLTASDFDAIGKLGLFKNAFNIKTYNKNLYKFFAEYIGIKYFKMHSEYIPMYEHGRKLAFKYPLKYLKGVLFFVYYTVKQKFKK